METENLTKRGESAGDVDGGGTPRGMLYRVLSILWCFPSLGAVYLLGTGVGRWVWGSGWVKWVSSVRLEEWVAVVLLVMHLIWLVMWRRRVGGRVSAVDSAGRI